MLETLMDYHGLLLYFLNPVGQDNHYAHGKEAAGKAWMEELHYGPHEVLLIGDTIHDREVAESIGADCVLLSHGHTSHERLMNTGGMVLKDFEELTLCGLTVMNAGIRVGLGICIVDNSSVF